MVTISSLRLKRWKVYVGYEITGAQPLGKVQYKSFSMSDAEDYQQPMKILWKISRLETLTSWIPWIIWRYVWNQIYKKEKITNSLEKRWLTSWYNVKIISSSRYQEKLSKRNKAKKLNYIPLMYNKFYADSCNCAFQRILQRHWTR